MRYVLLAIWFVFAFSCLATPAFAQSSRTENDIILEKMANSSGKEGRRIDWPAKSRVEWKTEVAKLALLEKSIKSLGTHDYAEFEEAVYKLEQMGEYAVPALVDILQDEGYSDRVYINAIYVTGRLKERGLGAISALSQYLYHKDPDYRAISSLAVGKMGPRADRVVPHLRRLLNDDFRWVRESAEIALFNIGTANALRSIKEHQAEQAGKEK